MHIKDLNERAVATDPKQSFIVQAPAGSGKTELLTQRYLRLLSTVDEPEQIIALTFTRKAANEMRERILKSLHLASINFASTSAHQQQTLQLANQVIKKNKWDILNQPARLRIITIDSLCQSICNAITLLEKQVSFANIGENTQEYYKKASLLCLQHALASEDLCPAITILLKHLDNNQNKLLELFSELLTNREQWLEPIFAARTQNKEQFEEAIAMIEQHELERFQKTVPQMMQNNLVALTKKVAIIENNDKSPRQYLTNWQSFASFQQA